MASPRQRRRSRAPDAMRTEQPYAVNHPTVHQSDLRPAWWTPTPARLIPMDALDLDDAMEAEVDDLLREGLVVWLTTVTPAGQPQTSPVWYHWDGHTFLIFSQPGQPKLANIAANPRVSLHPVGAPDAEDAVTIEATAALDHSAPPCDQIPEYIAKYLERIDYLEWTPASFAEDYSVALRITPNRFRIL